MGFLDDAVDKAQGLVEEHAAKIDDAIEKVGDVIDDKTGGKYADKIDSAQSFLEDKTGGSKPAST